MLKLRQYQRDSIDALYKYWEDGGGNGLIVLPTGAGKALVIAKLIEELLDNYPDLRIVNVTHSKTLVAQNYAEFIGLVPYAPAGLYSAGLGRRDANAQVIFGGIQSIATKTDHIGSVDLVLVDEAHAISRNSDTLYGKFFAGVEKLNPDFRRAGLTATDYRMDSGRLTDGDDRLFDDVVYEIGIGELIDQGYLTRLSSKNTNTQIDLTGVGTRGGEYIPGQLAKAADKKEVTEAAVREDLAWMRDRRAALFFCSGQDHSDHVRDEIRRQGKTCESLTSRVPLGEQNRIIEAFKAGEIWALASANMITTGANFPFVDCISLIRSTKSPGLLVQMLGRGTRNSAGKEECLVMDHGGNLRFHGPIDMIDPKKPGKGDGDAPVKLCPNVVDEIRCDELVHISVMVCPCCGYDFPPNEEVKLTPKADITPVLSTEDAVWHKVEGRKFQYHEKAGGTPSVKVTYDVDNRRVSEWVCPQHEGFAKSKADRYWSTHKGKRPFPCSVDEFLERAGELLITADVKVKFKGKWPEVKGHLPGTYMSDDVVEAPKTAGQAILSSSRKSESAHVKSVMTDFAMDDNIPF